MCGFLKKEGKIEMKCTLEVCVDSVQSALEAQKAKADRIELCSNLIIGGTSPEKALFQQVRYYTDLKIRVLLRPRFGDFCYDKYEFTQMKEEAEMYRELGADAIVTGILCPDGTLNVEQMQGLIKAADGLEFTLHRAFDMCRDAFMALEQAVELGIGTILTSGQKNSAWEGRKLLKELAEKSAGRVEILAGAGITPDVIGKLVSYTKITAYHMSGKVVKDSAMEFRRTGVNMGIPGFSEYEIWQTDAEKIREAAEVLKGVCKDD